MPPTPTLTLGLRLRGTESGGNVEVEEGTEINWESSLDSQVWNPNPLYCWSSLDPKLCDFWQIFPISSRDSICAQTDSSLSQPPSPLHGLSHSQSFLFFFSTLLHQPLSLSLALVFPSHTISISLHSQLPLLSSVFASCSYSLKCQSSFEFLRWISIFPNRNTCCTSSLCFSSPSHL